MGSPQPRRTPVACFVIASVLLGACGASSTGPDSELGASGRATVVVTSNILGDVVAQIAGDQAEVVTIMDVGVDPHDFQASAREVDQILSADALVVSGAGFEAGLLDVIESAQRDGVATYEAISAVTTIEIEGDDAGSIDPHFFTDPVRMADAVRGISGFLAQQIDSIDAAELETSTAAYLDELAALDGEVSKMIETIPENDRIMVTNHDVFGYFADRYDINIVGAVVPGGSTVDGAGALQLAELGELISSLGVPAIFTDASSSHALADTLAADVGEVAVVELYSESLGSPESDGATYLTMVRANADRVVDALT
jgi:zinc/manganese transport system substrate-binding protein